jgi:hypothetical protein
MMFDAWERTCMGVCFASFWKERHASNTQTVISKFVLRNCNTLSIMADPSGVWTFVSLKSVQDFLSSVRKRGSVMLVER